MGYESRFNGCRRRHNGKIGAGVSYAAMTYFGWVSPIRSGPLDSFGRIESTSSSRTGERKIFEELATSIHTPSDSIKPSNVGRSSHFLHGSVDDCAFEFEGCTHQLPYVSVNIWAHL